MQVLDHDLEAQQIIADQENELRDLRLSIRAYEAAAVDKRRRESANFDPRCTEPWPNTDTGSKQRRRGVAAVRGSLAAACIERGAEFSAASGDGGVAE